MKFKFDSYHLSVDYMAFSFPNERLESRRVTQLIDYLDSLGFSSFQTYPEKFQKKK